MTEAMDKLIAAVAAGELTVDGAPALSMEMSGIVYAAMGDDLWATCVEAFDGSLDAAVALKDALLPGWLPELREWPHNLCVATLRPPYSVALQAQGPSLARALLLATLRAVKGGADG